MSLASKVWRCLYAATAKKQQGETEPQPAVIGNGVWIGRRVMFTPGAKIGIGKTLNE